MRTALVLILSLGGLLIAACATGGSTTVEEICQTVFDCFDNDWGWPDQDTCVDQWFTGCADETGYLACTGSCVGGACEDFAVTDGTSGCEPDCWEEFCD